MKTDSYRGLTPREREFVIWLLENIPDNARNYLPQLEAAEVRSSCNCGCPSIEFRIPIAVPPFSEPVAFRCSFGGRSGEYDVNVMLTAGCGTLSELEISAIQEHEHAFDLPTIASLKR